MRKRNLVALAYLVFFVGPLLLSQDEPTPKPKPKTQTAETPAKSAPSKPKASASPAILLVICDLACNWTLDGEERGRIDAGHSAKARVDFGEHLFVATTDDGLDQSQQQLTITNAGQKLVLAKLTEARATRTSRERTQAEEEQRARAEAEQRTQAVRAAQAEREERARADAEQRARVEQEQVRPNPDWSASRLYSRGTELMEGGQSGLALPFYEAACDKGRARACTSAGTMYEAGNGVSEDKGRAAALYRTGCARGDEAGCTALKYVQ